MKNTDSIDAYTALITRLKKRRVMAGITSVLIFGGLSLLSAQGLVQTHWFIFFLFSLASGCWLLFFSRLISWLVFLRPRVKNLPLKKQNNQTYPVSNAFKKTQQMIITLSGVTGCLLFSIFLLAQSDTGDAKALTFGNIILLIALCAFLSLMAFVLILAFIEFILRIAPFPRRSRRYSSNLQTPLGDNHPFISSQKFETDEHPLASTLRKNWEHDPMNPASPEYQLTYRYWNNQDR